MLNVTHYIRLGVYADDTKDVVVFRQTAPSSGRRDPGCG
jgi:hypothetical protein